MALEKRTKSMNPSVISANLLAPGLHTNQAGSAFDFARAISLLTARLPDVWTAHYTGSGKKSAQNRLCYFLRKGSQGGPAEYWTQISSLISSLPPSIFLNATEDGYTDRADAEKRSHSLVLSALHEGLNSKAESRSSQSAAWNTYLDVFELVQASLPKSANSQELYHESILPILRQYIRPSPEFSRWTVSGSHQRSICLRASSIALLGDSQTFAKEWRGLSGQIIEDLKTSLPEQSKEYTRSQDSLLAETGRWYQLQDALLGGQASEFMRSIVEQSTPSEIKSIVGILKARNGKPYGAAAALEASLQWMANIILGNNATKETLLGFVNEEIPNLMLSPSATYLVRTLDLLEDKEDISRASERCMQTLAHTPESTAKTNALQSFVSSPRLAHNQSLFAIVLDSLRNALRSDDGAIWQLVMAAVVNPAAPKTLTDSILAHMVDCLTVSEQSSTGLHGLEMTAEQNPSMIKELASSSKGSGLLSTLLLLSESNNPTVSQKAKGLSSLVERAIAVTDGPGKSTKPLLEIIVSSVGIAGAESLSVNSLVSRAQKLYEQSSPEEMPDLAAALLPVLSQWASAMETFLARSPNPSLAVTNPFGGALSLISVSTQNLDEQPVARDNDGYSAAFRIALYTYKLIETTNILDYAANEHKSGFCKNLAFFLQLAGDNISITGSIPLWDSLDPEQESEIVNLIAEMHHLLIPLLQISSPSSNFVTAMQTQLLEDAKGLTVASYYNGRAYTAVTTEVREFQAYEAHDNDSERLKAMRRSVDVFASASYLTCAPESRELQRLGNELLADLTGLDFQTHAEEGALSRKDETYDTDKG